MALFINSKYNWYAIYTNPRAEKRVFQSLNDINVECYLPLQKRLRQWKDRKKWVEVPLISSYVFVKVSNKEYFNVLNIQGVSRYIFFEGKAAPIPEWQINIMKLALDIDPEVEATAENLMLGDPVEIIAGPFMGIKGKLIEYKGKKKVVIEIDNIGQSLLINVPIKFLNKCNF